MTDLSTLTDTELTTRICELQGYVFCVPEDGLESCCAKLNGETVWVENFPDFTTSLDALKSGPEKMLREAGWRLGDTYEALDGTWYVDLVHAYRDTIATRASTEERARAEAVCQGLEVGK